MTHVNPGEHLELETCCCFYLLSVVCITLSTMIHTYIWCFTSSTSNRHHVFLGVAQVEVKSTDFNIGWSWVQVLKLLLPNLCP